MQAFQRFFETDFTYLRTFIRNVVRYPQRIPLTCTSRQKSWTYAQVNREGDRLARALLQDGVGPNDVVIWDGFRSPSSVPAVSIAISAKRSGVRGG